MKKTVIATFGGVLAAGFLTVSAPMAHADWPGCVGQTGVAYQACEKVCATADAFVARGCQTPFSGNAGGRGGMTCPQVGVDISGQQCINP